MGVMSEHKINQLVIHDLQNAKIMSCSSGDMTCKFICGKLF